MQSHPHPHPFLRYATLLLLLLLATSRVDAELVVENIFIEGAQVRITATETDSIGTYRLQTSPNLAEGWTNVPAANVFVTGNLITIDTAYLEGRRFYRILSEDITGTAEDRDGDGLSNDFENSTTGTNPDLFDTDGDGWSDGQEFAVGTDPDDGADFPEIASLPLINFATNLSRTIEGDGTHNIPIRATPAFSGTVRYTIHSTSTASEGLDFQTTTGLVTMNGTSADIPITSIDNSAIDPERMIFIDLEVDNPRSYRTGGGARHILCLGDNDAYWSGIVNAGYLERGFRIELIRQGSNSTAFFVAGDGNDGLPTGDSTSLTVGLVPDGRHPATVTADSSSAFALAVDLPVTGASKLFGSAQTGTRTLSFTAAPTHISEQIISGSFSETTSTTLAPGSGAAITGAFSMARNPSPSPTTPAP